MESFFATLKKELLYRIPTYRMKMSEVKSWIFKYVLTYYNTVRISTSAFSVVSSSVVPAITIFSLIFYCFYL